MVTFISGNSFAQIRQRSVPCLLSCLCIGLVGMFLHTAPASAVQGKSAPHAKTAPAQEKAAS
ncbi:MAG: hypothetical protein RRY29_11080, partial [Desulfovibrionaceae bacterium]